jgi:hypothetical protein
VSSDNPLPSPRPDAPPAVADEALTVAQPLVAWLVRSGVGYAEFAAALKPVFLAQAMAEAQRLGQKPTDSALSLLSGLHRKDVRQLRASAEGDAAAVARRGAAWGRPSAASQVATRWLGLDWPDELPFAGSEPSFEALVRRVSTDFHHRAVLQELVRLGVVREDGERVHLLRDAFVPDRRLQEARQLLAGSVADHLAAGVHNLTSDGPRRFLEQSVFADGLSAQSVAQLHQLANRLWAQALAAVVAAAVPLCEQDAHLTEGTQRFRLGLFSYSAPEAAAVPPSPPAPPPPPQAAAPSTAPPPGSAAFPPAAGNAPSSGS